MKKTLLVAASFCAAIFSNQAKAQTRYLEEVFSSADVTSDVTYGTNFSVLTGTPVSQSLTMDVYEPTGDVETNRPLIIYLPTGSFLPRYINQLPTGDKTDSATVEMCTRLAKQGYVVAAVAYRTGWNPQALDQETRTETILQAVYRGLQDAKTAVRYFRKDVATNSNSYGIDDSKVCIGGQGSGGYISLAYATLDKLSEIQMLKFWNATANGGAGAFMVDTTVLGNWSGIGGNPALNNSNHTGYSDDVLMTFNIGGAIGDSSWLEDGEMPIVSFHGVADAFAPFENGIVTIPSTGGFVIDVSGSSDVIRIANSYGNNDIFKTPAITDVYTTAADGYNTAMDATYGNGGDEGLFAITGAANGNAPWEWYDTVAVKAEAAAYFQDPDVIIANGYTPNPVFQGLYEGAGYAAARNRAVTYIDTIQGYLAPRLYRGLIEQPFSVEEIAATGVSAYPNPANDMVTFTADNTNPMNSITFYSMEGKRVINETNINASTYVISNLDLPKGIYFATVKFKEGTTTKKIVIQ